MLILCIVMHVGYNATLLLQIAKNVSHHNRISDEYVYISGGRWPMASIILDLPLSFWSLCTWHVYIYTYVHVHNIYTILTTSFGCYTFMSMYSTWRTLGRGTFIYMCSHVHVATQSEVTPDLHLTVDVLCNVSYQTAVTRYVTSSDKLARPKTTAQNVF